MTGTQTQKAQRAQNCSGRNTAFPPDSSPFLGDSINMNIKIARVQN